MWGNKIKVTDSFQSSLNEKMAVYLRPLEVFRWKRVDGDFGNCERFAPTENFGQFSESLLMSDDRLLAALFGESSVSVHDKRHMVRNFAGTQNPTYAFCQPRLFFKKTSKNISKFNGKYRIIWKLYRYAY